MHHHGTKSIRLALVALTLLAAPLTAGGAPPDAGREVRGAAELPAKVNINTADVKELMTLAGVGRQVAERVVEYRRANGPFKRAEEIRRVEGIGAGLWQKNRARIVVD